MTSEQKELYAVLIRCVTVMVLAIAPAWGLQIYASWQIEMAKVAVRLAEVDRVKCRSAAL